MAHADARFIKNPKALVQNPKRQIPPLATYEQRFVIRTGHLIDFPPGGTGPFGEVVGFKLTLPILGPTPRVTPFAKAQGTGLFVADLIGEDVNIGTPGEGVGRPADFE